MKVMPKDFGVHHFISSAGVVQASNTRRAGASKVRVTTTSRSDRRSVTVSLAIPLTSLARFSIGLLLPFQFFDDGVQIIKARGPEAAVPFEPCGLFLESAPAKTAGADAPDLFGGHEARPFEDADVLLHARQGHIEARGELGDGRVGAAELLEHAATRGIGQGSKGRVDVLSMILNHVVQYCPFDGLVKREHRARAEHRSALLVLPSKEHEDDQEAQIGRVPALFEEDRPQDRQAPQPWHVRQPRGGGEARARRAIFQAALGFALWTKRCESRLRYP